MPPKKGVPWYESLRPKPFDKFMAGLKKALSKKVGTASDPDWATYASLMDNPENAEFKTMKDASGKTAEDYGFEAYISGIRSAMAMEPPNWGYYSDMVDYLSEFEDRRDSAGKTGEDYVFEMSMAFIQPLLRDDPPRLDLYQSMVEQLPQLKDRKDSRGKSVTDYAFTAFIGNIIEILNTEDPWIEWEDYIELLNDFPEFKNKKDDTGKSAVDYGMDVLLKMVKRHADIRDYRILLDEMPEFFNLKDADGKTLVMYAAEEGLAAYVETMIDTLGVDPRIKDNNGKTVYEYFEDYLTKETAYLNERYKNDPAALQRELEEIEENRDLLQAIKDAQAKETARLAEPLTRISKQFGKLGEGATPEKGMTLDALALATKYVTGVPGVPKTLVAEAKQQLGKGRKTRRKSKKSKKSRRRV